MKGRNDREGVAEKIMNMYRCTARAHNDHFSHHCDAQLLAADGVFLLCQEKFQGSTVCQNIIFPIAT